MLIAEYEKSCGEFVQIYSEDGNTFTVYDTDLKVQENLTNYEIVRYLSNAMHNVFYKLENK